MSCKERSDGGKQDRIKSYVESILDVYELTPEEKEKLMGQAAALLEGLTVQIGDDKYTAEEVLKHEEERNQEAESKIEGA